MLPVNVCEKLGHIHLGVVIRSNAVLYSKFNTYARKHTGLYNVYGGRGSQVRSLATDIY